MNNWLINPSLAMILTGVAIFVACIFVEPTAAEWLARILWARAQAVRGARQIYRRVRYSDFMSVQEPEAE